LQKLVNIFDKKRF